jgi:hypothetical protein
MTNKTHNELGVEALYNDHLSISRSFRHKPFRLRKDFSKFKEDKRYRHYVQLYKWFNIHPEIDKRLYFEATLFFHKDEEIVGIKEYCKTKALSNYTQYVKIVNSLDLDGDKQLDMCKKTFEFIVLYCESFGITIDEYITHKEHPDENYAFLYHIKEQKINVYALFSFFNFTKILKMVYRDKEMWEFYMGDFTPEVLWQRYEKSTKFKSLSTLIKNKLQIFEK